MLALLFRGVFLVGVIGWYSASLWKAVDHYFKSQFQRYLEEEYQRNPRMRDDVRGAYTAVDKAASDLIVAEAQCRFVESRGDDVCRTIDKADLFAGAPPEVKSQLRHRESVPEREFGLMAGAAEIEVARPSAPHTDLPAFQDFPAVDDDEDDDDDDDDEAVPPLPPAELHRREIPPTAIRKLENRNSSVPDEIQEHSAEKIPSPKPKQRQRKVEGDEAKKDEIQSPSGVKKRAVRAVKKKPKIEAKSEVVSNERKIKRRHKVPTLTLTEDDFAEAAEFFEFDREDNGNRKSVDNFEDDDDDDFNGIPLKDLPFKPMIDVYDLERVSEEEYCPLSLDDDPTCDELRSWP